MTSIAFPNLHSFLKHLRRPIDVIEHSLCANRRSRNQAQAPGEVSENTQRFHAMVQKLDDIVLLALLQHAKASRKANVSHDIEGIEVDPICEPH